MNKLCFPLPLVGSRFLLDVARREELPEVVLPRQMEIRLSNLKITLSILP